MGSLYGGSIQRNEVREVACSCGSLHSVTIVYERLFGSWVEFRVPEVPVVFGMEKIDLPCPIVKGKRIWEMVSAGYREAIVRVEEVKP